MSDQGGRVLSKEAFQIQWLIPGPSLGGTADAPAAMSKHTKTPRVEQDLMPVGHGARRLRHDSDESNIFGNWPLAFEQH